MVGTSVLVIVSFFVKAEVSIRELVLVKVGVLVGDEMVVKAEEFIQDEILKTEVVVVLEAKMIVKDLVVSVCLNGTEA